jgi:hypothetical protein
VSQDYGFGRVAMIGLMRKWYRLGLLSLVCALAFAGGVHAQQSPGKPQIRGLISMGNIGFRNEVAENSLNEIASRPGLLNAVVINFTWSQLQPTPDAVVTDPIDQALAQVRAYNTQNPGTPLAVKMRIWPGPDAPDWAKNLEGAPIPLKQIEGRTITIGRFWSAPYRQAWSKLQHALAQKYDSEPLIREVTDTSCSSLSDEPFIVLADPPVVSAMHSAGFTDEAYRACLMQSPADYSGWRSTSIDFSISPFRLLDGPHPVAAPQIDAQIMTAFRAALGSRGIFANHALSSPQSMASRNLTPIMELIKQFGPPTEFQTAAPRAQWQQGGQLDWDAAVSYANSLGASAIEVWQGANGFGSIPPEKLRGWSLALQRQTAAR